MSKDYVESHHEFPCGLRTFRATLRDMPPGRHFCGCCKRHHHRKQQVRDCFEQYYNAATNQSATAAADNDHSRKLPPPNNPPVPPPMPSPRSGVNLFDQARERFGNQPVRNRRRRQRPLKKLNRPSEQPRKKLPPPNNPPVPPPMPSPRSGVNLFDQARERFGNQPVRNRRRRQRPLKKLNRPSEQPRKKLPPPNNPPVPPPMPSPRSGVNLFDQARERFG